MAAGKLIIFDCADIITANTRAHGHQALKLGGLEDKMEPWNTFECNWRAMPAMLASARTQSKELRG